MYQLLIRLATVCAVCYTIPFFITEGEPIAMFFGGMAYAYHLHNIED